MKTSRLERILKGIAGVIVVLTVMTSVFALAFVLTNLIFPRIGFDPPALVRQVITSLIGLFLLGTVGAILGRIFRKSGWQRQMGVFGPLLNAMEQIARGDFDVRVTMPREHDADGANDPIIKLFKGVNDMALELKQMETLRQEFVSNVSHEIQSPLTSIRGFAQALQSDELKPEERHHYLSIIEMESMRLSKLSDNLLALASLEAENMTFEPKPYRLDQQIKSVILVCEPQWVKNGIDVDVSADEISITADEHLLSQVWMNLIHNAIKFTPQGGRIGVSLHRRDGIAEVTIADTGVGISVEDQHRIFERFFKADASRNRELGGSGLGLSIAKKIVDMHHGTISVESKPGVGTTFVVSLPLGQ